MVANLLWKTQKSVHFLYVFSLSKLLPLLIKTNNIMLITGLTLRISKSVKSSECKFTVADAGISALSILSLVNYFLS